MTPAHPSLWQPCNALSVAGWLALAVAGLAPQAVGASDAHAGPPKKAALEATKVAINAPDPLDKLRERLAERLAAVKVSDKPGALDLHVAPGAVGPAEAAAPAPSSRADTRREHKASSKSKATAHAKTGSHDAPHWAYSGEVGPQAWGGMKAEFSLCASGQRQSPIDIREGMAVDLEPIRFNYQPGGFAVIDNGHTVQVNLQPGNSIDVGGKRFDLLQFHFHRPSEERIDGRQFDMVAHLVHKSSEGKLAVVAVLLDKGSVQPLVQTIWNNLPLEKMLEVKARVNIDINQMLPTDKRYYTYMGSLTTPPCSEGVQWLVLRSPVAMSIEQIEIFSRMYPMNARPVQSASGRRIMQSN